MKPEQERVQDLLKDTVTTLCRNSLQYLRGMKVQGLLGITLDDDDVFVVHINEMFQNLGADGVLIQQADSVSLGEENRCSQSGVTEESPPPINIHPAIATLNTTSPLGRNASRRKTRPSRAIGGLSEPSCTIGTISEPVGALYDNSHEPHCGLASIKQEAESIVLDDDTVEPANVSDSYNISSCDGDDDADVGLMKQSYMEEAQLNLSMEQASAVSGVHTTTTLASPIQTDATGTPFPQVLAINPQFSQGGPFIAGVAQGFTDANANTSFQLQEVDGNTVIMGMPASALSQVVEGYQESWSLPHEELGLTTRGQPRKRRMWYRPRRAGTTTPSTDQGTVEESDTSQDTSALEDQSQMVDENGEIPSPNKDDSSPPPIVIEPRHGRSHNSSRKRSSLPSLNTKEYTCETCAKRYWSRNTLMRHQKSHDPNLVSCRKCTLYFETEDALKSHEEVKHVNAISGRYKCRFCEKVFRRKHQYLVHLRIAHNTISSG